MVQWRGLWCLRMYRCDSVDNVPHVIVLHVTKFVTSDPNQGCMDAFYSSIISVRVFSHHRLTNKNRGHPIGAALSGNPHLAASGFPCTNASRIHVKRFYWLRRALQVVCGVIAHSHQQAWSCRGTYIGLR